MKLADCLCHRCNFSKMSDSLDSERKVDKIPILSCSINYLRKHIHSFTDLSNTMGHEAKFVVFYSFPYQRIFPVFGSSYHLHGKCVHISTFLY